MMYYNLNILFSRLGGTIDQSSGVGDFAFDESTRFPYETENQADNTSEMVLTRTLEQGREIDTIFIVGTNIINPIIEIDSGSGFVALTSCDYTLTKSEDERNYYFKLNNNMSVSAFRLRASQTLVADSEKIVTQIYAFTTIGEIPSVEDIQPKRMRLQKEIKLITGRFDIINRGLGFEFRIRLKDHYDQEDNAVIEQVLENEDGMFIWINNNQERDFFMKQAPFRFGDLYKVAIVKNDTPRYSKNLYFSGFNNNIMLKEIE